MNGSSNASDAAEIAADDSGKAVQEAYQPTTSPKYDFPAFKGERKILIVASVPRSGSHYLGHTLHATGELGFPLEYFKASHWQAWANRAKATDPRRVLSAIKLRRTSPSGVFSVKIHWEQLKLVSELGLLEIFDGAQVVLIQRRSIVEQAVSWSIARQTSSWISAQEPLAEAHYSFRDIDKMVDRILEREAKWKRFLAVKGIAPIHVAYEDFSEDPVYWTRKIAAKVGLKLKLRKSDLAIPIARQRTEVNDRWSAAYREAASLSLE